MTPEEIHAKLEEAYAILISLRGNLDNLSADAAFAIKECAGQLSKAKALIGRDIDDRATPLSDADFEEMVKRFPRYVMDEDRSLVFTALLRLIERRIGTGQEISFGNRRDDHGNAETRRRTRLINHFD